MSPKHIKTSDKSSQKLVCPPPAPPQCTSAPPLHTPPHLYPHSHKQVRAAFYRALQACACVHMHACLYCTLPSPLPALRPAVSGVAAQIDKLTLKALCLRGLLEWEEKHHLLAAETRTHKRAVHISLRKLSFQHYDVLSNSIRLVDNILTRIQGFRNYSAFCLMSV